MIIVTNSPDIIIREDNACAGDSAYRCLLIRLTGNEISIDILKIEISVTFIGVKTKILIIGNCYGAGLKIEKAFHY